MKLDLKIIIKECFSNDNMKKVCFKLINLIYRVHIFSNINKCLNLSNLLSFQNFYAFSRLLIVYFEAIKKIETELKRGLKD
jgi:hypothetical protein